MCFRRVLVYCYQLSGIVTKITKSRCLKFLYKYCSWLKLLNCVLFNAIFFKTPSPPLLCLPISYKWLWNEQFVTSSYSSLFCKADYSILLVRLYFCKFLTLSCNCDLTLNSVSWLLQNSRRTTLVLYCLFTVIIFMLSPNLSGFGFWDATNITVLAIT